MSSSIFILKCSKAPTWLAEFLVTCSGIFILKDWDKNFLWFYMKNISTLGTICVLCSFLLNGLWLQIDILFSNVRQLQVNWQVEYLDSCRKYLSEIMMFPSAWEWKKPIIFIYLIYVFNISIHYSQVFLYILQVHLSYRLWISGL